MKILTGTSDHHYTLVDGGVFANNPAACALVEARATHPDADGCLVVSLGTGSLNRSLPVAIAKYWGTVRWAKPLIDIVFDGVSSTVDYQLKELLPGKDGDARHYYRFQTVLDSHNSSMDNASPDNITALKGLALRMMDCQSKDLEELCEKLTANEPVG